MSRHARNNRPALAPIAHAVRKALAASALLAALSAPAAGFAADACPAGAIRRCDAAIARDASLLLPLHDPALVAGDAVPVAVQALLPASDFASGIAVWDAYAAVLDNSRAILARQLLRRADDGASLGRVTFSAGVAQLRPADSPDSLIDRADAALYTAKRSGRDRVLPERPEAAG